MMIMRKVFIAILLGGLVLQAAPAKKIGSVTFILGGPEEVQIKHAKAPKWLPVKLKMDVLPEDAIKTETESRCEVKLNDGSIIRIGENTIFEFSTVQNMANLRAELKQGKIWANLVSYQDTNKDFQIKAPTAVCAVRGTIYRIDADSTTTCLVYDGKVDVGPVSLWQTPQEQQAPRSLEPVEIPGPTEIPPPYEVSLEQWISIVQGYQITVRGDGKYAKSQFDPQQDANLEWVQWNQQLDSGIRR